MVLVWDQRWQAEHARDTLLSVVPGILDAMRSRVLYLFLGALGMLVLIVVAAAVTWWSISEPLDDRPSSSAPRPAVTQPGEPAPPPVLGTDEVWIGAIELSSELLLVPDATLRDVVATGRGIYSGAHGLTVAYLDVDATVPFAEVAKEVGGDSVVKAAPGGQVAVERTVEVLGRGIPVVATGTVDVVGGKIVVRPTAIDFGLPEFLSKALGTLVDSLVTIEHEVTGLPENLKLLDVSVLHEGFRASLAGSDVVLAETNR